jgi:hypothetical protein
MGKYNMRIFLQVEKQIASSNAFFSKIINVTKGSSNNKISGPTQNFSQSYSLLLSAAQAFAFTLAYSVISTISNNS